MEPSRIHDFASFTSYINTKLVTLKKMEARFEIKELNSLWTKRQSQLLLITDRMLRCDFFQDAGLQLLRRKLLRTETN